MSTLESRLRRELAAQSDLLPSPALTPNTAVERGRQRRRRSFAVSTAGLVLLLGGLAAATGPVLEAINRAGGDRSGSVVADQPQIPIEDGSNILESDSEPQVLEVESTTTTAPVEEGSDPSTSTPVPSIPVPSIPVPSVTTQPGTGGGAPGDLQRTPAQAIGRLPPESVLFHSDHEGCREIEGSQAHPDWIEGQPSSGRNGDGSRTYGFAYNTGNAGEGDIAWSFVESEQALSGECVLSMTLNRADTHADAVRLVRRYDRNGDPLPEAAFYSVWLYFPQHIEYQNRGTIEGDPAFGFWNVFQIKNDVVTATERESLSALTFIAGKLPDDPFMSLTANAKTRCGSVDDCGQTFAIEQGDPAPIPVGQWVHFELFLRSRPDEDGQLRVWQDGKQILSYDGQTERLGTERRTWSVNTAGQLHTIGSHTLLVDDPLISTRSIHPELFGQ